MGVQDRAGLLVAFGRQEVSDWWREHRSGFQPAVEIEREVSRRHTAAIQVRAETNPAGARRDAEVWASTLHHRHAPKFSGVAGEFDRAMSSTFPGWVVGADPAELWR